MVFNLDHYFKAGLCKLWYNGENAHSKFNIYCEEFPAFFGMREAQLLAELIAAVKNSDFGEFTKEHVKILIFLLLSVLQEGSLSQPGQGLVYKFGQNVHFNGLFLIENRLKVKGEGL